MITEVVKVDCHEREPLRQAAQILQSGGLVAFPTETVYGLGANAISPDAVSGIFQAKGRPSNNPLIVHIATVDQAKDLVQQWPNAAERLAQQFWPGPLTLVLEKKAIIPDIVTAGGSTVALRIPSHPIALALLQESGLPLAAPSANRSQAISPTTARHVLNGLNGRIPMILDGGPTSGGLESTVLNLTTAPPQLLRPGLITPSEIEAVIGPIERSSQRSEESMPLPSPGMLSRHYAPRAPLLLTDGNGMSLVTLHLGQDHKVGWLTFENREPQASLIPVVMPKGAGEYAARLYAALHELDQNEVDVIIVENPPSGEAWQAIHDRLKRASEPLPEKG